MIILLPLVLLLVAICSAQQNATVQIYKESKTYSYYGCYNETTEVQGSSHSRALSGGTNEVKKGEMTVPMCLDFCYNGDNRTNYRYAGLEWSRECWCADNIAGIAKKLDDAECNFPCEGNNSLACGGSLKLSVYKISSAAGIATPVLLTALVSGLAALVSL